MSELLFQSKQYKLPDTSIVLVVKVLGAIDGSTTSEFEDKLLGFLNQSIRYVVLNFSHVKYINSTGMGLLIKIADKYQEIGGDVKIVKVPDKVVALFDMLGLLSLFKMLDSEEEALESFAESCKKTSPAPVNNPIRPSTEPHQNRNRNTPRSPQVTPLHTKNMQVTWPHSDYCQHCRTPLKFPKEGRYQCNSCGRHLAVAADGSQTVYGNNSPHLELKLSSHPHSIEPVRETVRALSCHLRYPDNFCQDIQQAVATAMEIIVDKSQGNHDNVHIVASGDAQEIIIGLKSNNPIFRKGTPQDPRLSAIAKKVSRLEVFPLPNKGQMLKITKKL